MGESILSQDGLDIAVVITLKSQWLENKIFICCLYYKFILRSAGCSALYCPHAGTHSGVFTFWNLVFVA